MIDWGDQPIDRCWADDGNGACESRVVVQPIGLCQEHLDKIRLMPVAA